MNLAAAPRTRAYLAGAAIVSVVALVAVACSDGLPGAFACEEIPEGGCPTKSIDVCVDVTCAAVYSCGEDTKWTKLRDCPARAPTGDAGTDGSDDANTADGGPGHGRDADIDAPPGASGGPGCLALQTPECSLGYALACDPDDCCGCEDIFVCDTGGWSLWGSCNSGNLTKSP